MRSVPTTTVLLSRLQVFEPTRRPKGHLRSDDTSWGHFSVDGRLGQGHADVLELILFLAMDSVRESDGRIHLLIDEYKVRKGLGRGQVCSAEQFVDCLDELMGAQIELRSNGWKTPIAGKLIDEVRKSTQTVPALGRITSAGRKDGQRHLKVVVLGHLMSGLIGHDVPLFYDPHPIVDCKIGVAQALVRHVKTHKSQPKGGWKIETLLQNVGAGQKKMMSIRRREIKACNEYLRGLGISVEQDRVLLPKKQAQ